MSKESVIESFVEEVKKWKKKDKGNNKSCYELIGIVNEFLEELELYDEPEEDGEELPF
jgi:hypothetical protein